MFAALKVSGSCVCSSDFCGQICTASANRCGRVKAPTTTQAMKISSGDIARTTSALPAKRPPIMRRISRCPMNSRAGGMFGCTPNDPTTRLAAASNPPVKNTTHCK